MNKGEIDEEQCKHAMADPEVQQIICDPQFQLILKKISENPMTMAEYLKDPKISNGIQKLIAAGLLTILWLFIKILGLIRTGWSFKYV